MNQDLIWFIFSHGKLTESEKMNQSFLQQLWYLQTISIHSRIEFKFIHQKISQSKKSN